MEGTNRGQFDAAVVDGVISEADEPAGFHDFAAEDADGFHAVAEEHQNENLAGMITRLASALISRWGNEGSTYHSVDMLDS